VEAQKGVYSNKEKKKKKKKNSQGGGIFTTIEQKKRGLPTKGGDGWGHRDKTEGNRKKEGDDSKEGKIVSIAEEH